MFEPCQDFGFTAPIIFMNYFEKIAKFNDRYSFFLLLSLVALFQFVVTVVWFYYQLSN